MDKLKIFQILSTFTIAEIIKIADRYDNEDWDLWIYMEDIHHG